MGVIVPGLIRFFILVAAFSLLQTKSYADLSPGDSLWVQTFTFDSIETRRGVFDFPDNDLWNRILMLYTLKCDEATPGDPYPCGEWDVNTYIRVYRDTGRMDSTMHTHVVVSTTVWSY